MATKGHLLYYPEGKHDILLGKELNDILKSKVNSITKITYQDLKKLRDNSKLTPGALYRITDYQCTTTQENTRSAGHQFDIVLLALSENKLAEEGWAMMNESNVYDVTFGDEVTKKCWLYTKYQYIEGEGIVDIGTNVVDITTLLGIAIGSDEIEKDNVTKTAIADGYESTQLTTPDLTYNYFQNSNLSAWKVWYCLDNDKSRFAWAQGLKIMYKYAPFDDAAEVYVSNITRIYNNQTYYSCLGISDDTNYNLYVTDKNINQNTTFYTFAGPGGQEKPYIISSVTIIEEGTGVIYRLIDEWNNDIKYDFKNIQFKRKLTDGQYDATNGTDTWCYTLNIWYNGMCQDASIVGNTLTDDEQKISGVHNNSFGCIRYDFPIEEPNTITFALGNNVILSIIEDSYYYGIYNNNFGYFFNNTIGSNCDSNIIGNYSSNNIIRNGFRCNLIGNYFYGNSIGENFTQNVIGNSFINNDIDGVFAFNFVANSFGGITITSDTRDKNYGNNGVELATKS